jgi:hypothetical protein
MNTKNKINDLSCQCVEAQPIYFDFSEEPFTETWDIPLELTEDEIENEEFTPTMNYIYPLPDEFQVPKDFRQKLNNMTIVYLMNEKKYYLALTGGGMDFSWEISESYINLGLLPPSYVANLPQMAGRGTGKRDKLIIDACRESLWMAQRWAKDRLVNFDNNFKNKGAKK